MSEEAIIKLASLFIILLGLIALLMTLTVFFGAIRKLESHIATPGKQLDEIKKIWGNGPIGRWMRAVHLYFFFLIRKLPVYGPIIGARMGDEKTPSPRRLKMALMIPMDGLSQAHMDVLVAFPGKPCPVPTPHTTFRLRNHRQAQTQTPSPRPHQTPP